MSQWTHVNAVIRFDGILGQGLPTEFELGEICRWEDEDTSHWHTTILPCGSEGSIEYQIWRNPSLNSMAAMTVMFFGDLRDYDDASEILNYFKNLTTDKMIRSGVLEIDVEFKTPKVYRFDTDVQEWRLLKPLNVTEEERIK